MGVRGGPRALSLHATPPPGLSVGSLLTSCQPALSGNSDPLPTLFLLQRSSHLSWSTRRRSRASSPDTPISPFRCLVLMAATTIFSAAANLAEGTDPRGGARPTRLCVLCPADYIQGLCASPTLPPFPDSSPFCLGWSQVAPGRPRSAAFCPGPVGPADLIFSSCPCFQLAWEQYCAVEPAGHPATCIPMGLQLSLQHRA